MLFLPLYLKCFVLYVLCCLIYVRLYFALFLYFVLKLLLVFASSTFTVHVGDGLKFMEAHENEFDVIITDSSDPVGMC